MKITNPKTIVAMFLSIALTSCAGTPPKMTGIDTAEYPSGWSPMVVGQALENYCPDIDGMYLSDGKSNSTIGERFFNPIFERSFFNQIEIADETNFFTLEVNFKARNIHFEIFNADGELLTTENYKEFTGCEYGWFVVESFVKGGSGDNPHRSTYQKTFYGLAEDGSLLIYSYLESVSGKWIIGSETKKTGIWYMYKASE